MAVFFWFAGYLLTTHQHDWAVGHDRRIKLARQIGMTQAQFIAAGVAEQRLAGRVLHRINRAVGAGTDGDRLVARYEAANHRKLRFDLRLRSNWRWRTRAAAD